MDGSESGKRRGRKAAKKDVGIDESPRKCTVVLPAKLDWKLDAYASMRRMDRSAVVVEALEAMLGSVVVSIRGPREDIGMTGPRIVRDEGEAGEETAAA